MDSYPSYQERQFGSRWCATRSALQKLIALVLRPQPGQTENPKTENERRLVDLPLSVCFSEFLLMGHSAFNTVGSKDGEI